MAPTTEPRRSKGHPAAVSRVVAAGLASAGSLGIVAVLLSGSSPPATVALPTRAAATTTVPVPAEPDTVIVIREVPVAPTAGAPPPGTDAGAGTGAVPSGDQPVPGSGDVGGDGSGGWSGSPVATASGDGSGAQGGAAPVGSTDIAPAPAAVDPGPVAPPAEPAPAPAPQPAPVTASPATTPVTTATGAS